MPQRRTEMPSTIEKSDKQAQKIWRETHDSAVESYGEGERAHRTAFAALKHSYRKEGDHWVAKSVKGPSDPQAARGPDTRPKSTARRPARTAGGHVVGEDKPRTELYEQAKRLDIPGRSRMNRQELAEAIQASRR